MTTDPARRPVEVARLLEAARAARSRWLAAQLRIGLAALWRSFGPRPAAPAPRGAR